MDDYRCPEFLTILVYCFHQVVHFSECEEYKPEKIVPNSLNFEKLNIPLKALQ